MSYSLTLTAAGAAKFAAAIGGGVKITFAEMVFSSAVPVGETISSEVARRTITSIATAANYVDLSSVIPGAVGGFTIRGLYVTDIDGVVIAYGAFPETYKPAGMEGSLSSITTKARINLADAGSGVVTVEDSVPGTYAKLSGNNAFTGNQTVTGNVSASGTFHAGGNATLGGTLTVTGNSTFAGTLGVVGALTLTAGASVGGTLAVTGKTSLHALEIDLGSDATGDLYFRNSAGDVERLPVGTNGHVLTLSGGLPSWAAAAAGGLVNFTESVNSAVPNNTVPAVRLLATNAASNVDFVLSPKGTGAILAQLPDNTTTGGNKRGTNSVDLQTLRTSADQVAGGVKGFIGGGDNNKIGSTYNSGVIGGGSGNTISGNLAVICGGSGHTVGTWSCVTGGFSVSCTGSTSTAGGGTITVGGDYCTAFGRSLTIAAGSYNVAMGQNHYITNGSWNALFGNNHAVPTSGCQYNFLSGSGARVRETKGSRLHAGGSFSAVGDAQIGDYILRGQTTGTANVALTADQSAASNDNQVKMPNNGNYFLKARVVARHQGGSDAKVWEVSALVCRASSVITFVGGSATVTSPFADAGAAAWALTVSADNTNASIKFEGAGDVSKTIRWVVHVETVENLNI